MKLKNIGIISPSSNVLSIFPKRMEAGIKNLNDIGFNPIFSKNSLRKNDYSKKSIDERLDEINELINEDLNIIMASIGGYLSIQILNKINYNLIKEKNIVFCGYSDITALLLAIYVKTGLIMLYGPTYTVNLCDYGGIDDYTKQSFLDCYNHKDINYKPSNYSINEYIDWKDLENNIIIKNKTPKEYDWHVIKKGNCKGKLIGGNLTTLLLILGTEFLPIETFNNSILFLEDCETNINEFCSYLESLRLKGVLDKVNGIIFGKFDTNDMNDDIDDFLIDYFAEYNIPIASNLDFGHVFPCLTLPIGAKATLDCNDIVDLKVFLKNNC